MNRILRSTYDFRLIQKLCPLFVPFYWVLNWGDRWSPASDLYHEQQFSC